MSSIGRDHHARAALGIVMNIARDACRVCLADDTPFFVKHIRVDDDAIGCQRFRWSFPV